MICYSCVGAIDYERLSPYSAGKREHAEKGLRGAREKARRAASDEKEKMLHQKMQQASYHNSVFTSNRTIDYLYRSNSLKVESGVSRESRSHYRCLFCFCHVEKVKVVDERIRASQWIHRIINLFLQEKVRIFFRCHWLIQSFIR